MSAVIGWGCRSVADGIGDEHLGAVPAPVDAVGDDAPVGQHLDLGDVDLVSVGGVAWVLPSKRGPVPEEATVAVPADERVRPSAAALGGEPPQLVAAS